MFMIVVVVLFFLVYYEQLVLQGTELRDIHFVDGTFQN